MNLIIELKNNFPCSVEFGLKRDSEALSGCGINPKQFLSKLHTPAILSIDPFGFEVGRILPSEEQYLNII
jgi:hypothetical protein